MRTGVALVAALTAVAGLCGACSSGDADPAASPSPLSFGPPSFPATASPTPTDPYAIPDTIDAAYIEKVYGALAEVEVVALEALREAYGMESVLPPDTRDRLRAVYGPESFPIVAGHWQDVFTREEPPAFPTDLRPVSIDVHEVVRADEACVVVLAEYDFSGISTQPPEVEPVQYLALIRHDQARDPSGFNPTPWVVGRERATVNDDAEVESLCVS